MSDFELDGSRPKMASISLKTLRDIISLLEYELAEEEFESDVEYNMVKALRDECRAAVAKAEGDDGHMGKQKDGLMLSEAIEQMREAICNRDISDKTLRKKRCSTRKDDFCSELSYGITMVPCTFSIQLAKKVLEIEGDQFIPFDTD